MIHIQERRGSVRCLAYAPDGKTLASGGGRAKAINSPGVVTLWDVSTGEKRMVLGQGHGFSVAQVAFSPDGSTLASGSGFRDEGDLWLADLCSGTECHFATGYEAIFALVFDPTGETIATAGGGPVVWLWDVTRNKAGATQPVRAEVRLGRLKATYVQSLAYSPDGQTLAVAIHTERRVAPGNWRGVNSHEIQLRASNPGQPWAVLRGHEATVFATTFSPDGALVASGSEDKTIRLWDATTGQERAVLRGHDKGVNSLAFAPNGRTLVSGGEDGKVTLWDVAAGKECVTRDWGIGPVRAIAVAPDGSTAAAVGKGGIVIWDQD